MQEVQTVYLMIYGSNKFHITIVINSVIKEVNMDQIKTYRPVHLNMQSDLLYDLDMYKGDGKNRSQLIPEAVRFYIDHLEQTGVRPKRWTAR